MPLLDNFIFLSICGEGGGERRQNFSSSTSTKLHLAPSENGRFCAARLPEPNVPDPRRCFARVQRNNLSPNSHGNPEFCGPRAFLHNSFQASCSLARKVYNQEIRSLEINRNSAYQQSTTTIITTATIWCLPHHSKSQT